MEKGSLGSKRSKVTSHWGETRDATISDSGQTEYLTRLTTLRDSLIGQEQVFLATAIERLRLHSLSNKSSSHRLRMNGCDVKIPTAQSPRTTLLTTVEKFRQMRPQIPQPVILPLEGKQIFDRNSPKRSSSNELPIPSEGSADIGETDNAVEPAPLLAAYKVDGTSRRSSQRPVQPISSIPNIGRKARKRHEHFEPKTKSLLSLQSRVHKQTGRHLTSPFLPISNTRSLSSSSSSFASSEMTQKSGASLNSGHVSSSIIQCPDVWRRAGNYKSDGRKVEENHDEDFVNFYRIENHRCREEDVENGRRGRRGGRGYVIPHQSVHKTGVRNKQSTFHKIKQSESIDQILYGNGFTSKYVNSDDDIRNNMTAGHNYGNSRLIPDKSQNEAIMNGYRNSNSDVDEYDKELFDNTETLLPEIYPTQINSSQIDPSQIDPSQNRVSESVKYSSYKDYQSARQMREIEDVIEFDLNIRNLPMAFVQNGEELHSKTSKPGRFNQNGQFGGIHENRTQKKHIFVQIPHAETQESMSQNINLTVNIPHTETQENIIQKKHITVNMPSIILNAPSPVPEPAFLDDNPDDWQSEKDIPHLTLGKTAQQQEIRINELTNLLEDMKELSMKAEAMKFQSAAEVGLQHNAC